MVKFDLKPNKYTSNLLSSKTEQSILLLKIHHKSSVSKKIELLDNLLYTKVYLLFTQSFGLYYKQLWNRVFSPKFQKNVN